MSRQTRIGAGAVALPEPFSLAYQRESIFFLFEMWSYQEVMADPQPPLQP